MAKRIKLRERCEIFFFFGVFPNKIENKIDNLSNQHYHFGYILNHDSNFIYKAKQSFEAHFRSIYPSPDDFLRINQFVNIHERSICEEMNIKFSRIYLKTLK